MQGVEAVLPEGAVLGQPGVYLGQWLRAQAVDPPLRLRADIDQTGLSENS